MSVDPLGGIPPAAPPVAPASGLSAKLGGPTTITTIIGALIAIAIGTADVWYFHAMSYDQGLIFGGLGALLGVNPITQFARRGASE